MSNSYTPEQRAEAVAMYAEHGPSYVEREMGIPKGTVTKWGQADGVETRFIENAEANVQASCLKWEQRRADLVHKMGELAEKAMQRVEDSLYEIEHITDHKGNEIDARYTANSAKGYATTMAILVDKAQLLSGAATTRNESIVFDARDELVQKAEELLQAGQ